MKNQFIFTVDLKNDKCIKKGNWQIRIENIMKEYFGEDNIKSYTYEWNPLGEEIIKMSKVIVLKFMDSLISYFDSKHESKIVFDIQEHIKSFKNR